MGTCCTQIECLECGWFGVDDELKFDDDDNPHCPDCGNSELVEISEDADKFLLLDEGLFSDE